jgi:hypothetical protein
MKKIPAILTADGQNRGDIASRNLVEDVRIYVMVHKLDVFKPISLRLKNFNC